MPSSPRKRAKAKARETSKHVDDNDSDDSYNGMPPLVHSDSDDEPRDDWPRRLKACNNTESVEMWLDLGKPTRERHIHVMKIYLLSPFLFDSVEQDDKWINWAHECKLLSNKRNCEPAVQVEECIEAVDIVEEAFNKAVTFMLAKEDSEEIEKALGMMDKINTLDKIDNAIVCAESFTTYLRIRERIKTVHIKRKSDSKRKIDTSLLLAFQQIYDHIKKLTQENKDLSKQFDEMCTKGEQQSADLKKKGNNHFMEGKYKAAISAYEKAILMSQYNHILYGNRAQSYLRTGETVLALADGRRSVILDPEWVKGQYRYAQAFFDHGDIERAIAANREAKQSCHKNNKDLDSQYERFLRERDVKAKKIAKNMKLKEVQLKMPNELDDLPDLVEPDSGDTSGDSDNDDDNDDFNDDGIESSDDIDSNSDNESVPELVTDSSKDSDSDDDYEQRKHLAEELKLKNQGLLKSHINHTTPGEKELKKKKRKDQKEKHDQGRKKEMENGVSEAFQKRKDLNITLKQGSKAYLDGKWKASINFYEQAMQMLTEDDPFQVFKIKRIDFILILYSHGTACLETRIHKELMEATKKFETITIQYKEIKFPLAYYGLGRVFHLQNRFNEALEPLNKGLDIVKSGDFGEYRWPGTQFTIEESEPGKLEVAFKTIIALCQHPPKPDAVCRFTDCQGRSAIYLTDPDYKGYVRLICDDSCKIEYHPVCWKKYRSTYTDRNGEKDFLEEECITPDCAATLVHIQIYGSEGLKTEFVVENAAKQKQGKVKTHSNQKTKSEKKKREEIKAEQHNNTDAEDDEPKKIEELPPDTKNKPTKPDEPEPTEREKAKAQMPTPEVNVVPDTRDSKDGDAGVYILRKNEERLPDDLLAFRGVKSKSKKKKVKNIQSLDEFLKDHGGEVFKLPFGIEEDGEEPEKPTMIPPSQWSEDELVAPFAIPHHLRADIQDFERHYHADTDPGLQQPLSAALDEIQPKANLPMDPIDDYIISLFTETLNAHGPMDVADARIIEPINYLPESHQQKIRDCGGIKQFLMKSEQFVVQGNVVMLPDELHFQEIVKNVHHYLNGGKNDFNINDTKTPDFTFPSFNDSHLSFSEHNDLTPCPPIAPPMRSPIVEPIEQVAGHSSPETAAFQTKQTTNVQIKTETLPLKPSEGKTTDPQQIIFCENEKVNKELRKFVEPLEKVGIPPTSQSIVNLITSMKLGESLGDSKLTDEQKEPLLRNVGHLLDQIEVRQVPKPILLDGKLSLQTANNEVKSSSSKSTCVNTEVNSVQPCKGQNGDSSPLLNTPPKHKRAGSSGSDFIVGVKTKGVQTQLQVKSKGVMTDSMPEPFKLEYMKTTQERDELQRKLQDITEKLNNIQRKHDQEVDKMKKKTQDMQSEKERLSKELQSAKQEGKSELKKMEKMCEEKDKLATSLEQRFKLEQERYQSTIAGLKAELEAKDSELQNERAKLSSVISQRDEALKKAVASSKQQESRAQDAEVKLLELRRDVGLKFLERSLQEASYTANNLITVRNQSVGTSSKMDELINSWRVYFLGCQQKAANCRNNFNAQIQEVSNGSVLSSLRALSIPGPAVYPGQPVLHLNPPLVTHIQSSFQLTPADMTIPSQVYNHPSFVQQPRPVGPSPVLPAGAASVHQPAPVRAAAPPMNPQQPRQIAPSPVLLAGAASVHQPAPVRGAPPPRNPQQPRPVGPSPVPPAGAASVHQSAPVRAAAPPRMPQQPHPVAPSPVLHAGAASVHQSAPVRAAAPPRMPQQPHPVAPSPVHAAASPRIPQQQVPAPTTTPPLITQQVQHGVAAEGSTGSAPKTDGDKGRPSNSFERIMLRLSIAYPYLARAELTSLIKEVRQSKKGTLTGLSLEEIVQSVDLLVDAKIKEGAIRIPQIQQAPGVVRSNSSQFLSQIQSFGATANNAPHPLTTIDSSSHSSLTFEADEDDPCVICHDDMRSPLDTVVLECGHKYHNKCIRKWLMGEQSTCPTCRVHALLPDEFPRLK